MPPTPKPIAVRYNHVTFHFCHPDEDENDEAIPGVVILRPGEMVLELHGGYAGRYDIIGRPATQSAWPLLPNQPNHWFEGRDLGKSGAEACWADVGKGWVGFWSEEGDYKFSFVLRASDAEPIYE